MKDDSAFPYAIPKLYTASEKGLTKREFFAGLAMIGYMIAGTEYQSKDCYDQADRMLEPKE